MFKRSGLLRDVAPVSLLYMMAVSKWYPSTTQADDTG